MMKYLTLIVCIFIWKLSTGNQQLRSRIDTAKYNITNQKLKELNVKIEKWYSDKEREYWYAKEYDTLGRIVAVFNHIYHGKRYFYSIKNDTLTRTEYESKNNELINLNKIEKFIYNESGKIKTYISTYKKIQTNFERTKIYSDTIVFIEVDQIFYDTHQRFLKINHFSKPVANQELQYSVTMPIHTLHLVSSDTFNYDLQQRTAVSAPSDSFLTGVLFEHTIYDENNRVIKETTVCIHPDFKSSDTIEEKYIYERKKITRRKKEYGYPGTSPFVTIRTEYYSNSGLVQKMTFFRERLKEIDILYFKYEFFS